MTEDNNKSEKKTEINIIIYSNTWKQSLRNDLVTLSLLTGLVWVNEATLQSAFLNFLFGLIGLVGFFHFAKVYLDDRTIRGTDPEEVLAKVRKKLERLNDN